MTEAMSTVPEPEVRFGVILDEGGCCVQCLKVEEQDFRFSKPWYYVGELFSCVRCKTSFRMTE